MTDQPPRPSSTMSSTNTTWRAQPPQAHEVSASPWWWFRIRNSKPGIVELTIDDHDPTKIWLDEHRFNPDLLGGKYVEWAPAVLPTEAQPVEEATAQPTEETTAQPPEDGHVVQTTTQPANPVGPVEDDRVAQLTSHIRQLASCVLFTLNHYRRLSGLGLMIDMRHPEAARARVPALRAALA